MPTHAHTPTARPLGQHGTWIATAAALLLIVAWDLSGADMAVMRWLGTAQGFAARDAFWWSRVGHDGLRQLATIAWVLLWLAALWPAGPLDRLNPLGHFTRSERWAMGVGVTAALVVVSLIKRQSATSCPWDLDVFGGAAQWVSHWDWSRASDGGPGHCFPGGHASGALAFLGLAWPGLSSPRDSARGRFARRALWAALLGGLFLGLVQTVRGAHPPSHTAWTAWLCWTSSALVHALHTRAIRSRVPAAATARPATPPQPATD